VNTKKRSIAVRESMASHEEEVEDLQAVEQIKEILHGTHKPMCD
jgi:predicted DNA-binding protein